jgi:hypothetical protein
MSKPEKTRDRGPIFHSCEKWPNEGPFSILGFLYNLGTTACSCIQSNYRSLREEFFIFNLSRFCKNIWSGTNLAKIYIWRRGPWRQGHNAVGRGARCQQEWALSRNAKGHDVKSLTPWSAKLGAQCPASACR